LDLCDLCALDLWIFAIFAIVLGMSSLSASERTRADALLRDLDRVFDGRLQSLGVYHSNDQHDRLHTLAVVDRLTFDDLGACVPLADDWLRRGIAVPLILSAGELQRTLDIFPLEYTPPRRQSLRRLGARAGGHPSRAGDAGQQSSHPSS
jgi:hypothetical protein